ncbi:hypothetical protein EPA93_10985 [Ktedonosporobacter rubrisoli]|uniref:Carbohydrate kinase n=1 Tax=Ktedonosporobacter rubrisoli TaxID=2509675 RepID=A0A4P6JMM9_KTERU|nr:FGGY-family carbohydrate kinase [Ktedonosporobacter rubrisoli]QBD76505.1 hypothetical protein EPA93_10985 [Ktedonosporobacter rubrisoli]
MVTKGNPRYVIGLDMGTQGVRCLAVTAEGAVLARASVPLPAQALLTAAKTFEQQPEEWWQATARALAQLSAQLRAANIAVEGGVALCVSGTSGTFVPLDAAHQPLRPALMYSDARAVDEVAICNTQLAELTESMGYRFNASFALPKLLWLARHEAQTWERTAMVAHQADYLVGRLTDVWGISDYTNVLKTGYDLLSDSYPDALSHILSSPAERLPRIVAPGTPIAPLRPEVAAELGLNANMLVVAGLTDGCASQFAAGASEPGTWVSSLGTTLTIKGVSATLIKDKQGRLYCHRHPERGWLPGGASSTGGEVLARNFANVDLAAYDGRAASLLPTNLLSYPLVRRGERFPFVAPQAEGFQIAPAGSVDIPAELAYAAALEGVALVERLAFEVVGELGAPVKGAIRAVGGASQSQLWLRIRASVSQRPFVVPAIADPAMGVAVLAAAGRLHADLGSATRAMVQISQEVQPDPAWISQYEERYSRFKDELRQRGYLA